MAARDYTAASRLGKSTAMRLVVLIIIAGILLFALILLSTVPKQQPTRTIEVEVPQPAGGNAH